MLAVLGGQGPSLLHVMGALSSVKHRLLVQGK